MTQNDGPKFIEWGVWETQNDNLLKFRKGYYFAKRNWICIYFSSFRSTILGQAIGKLLENKSKSNISVQKMEKSKKSSPNKSEQDLGNNKNKKLVKSKSSNFDSDVDADVEDELSESDLAVISKPKLVRKSASLSLTSPEKGTNFP